MYIKEVKEIIIPSTLRTVRPFLYEALKYLRYDNNVILYYFCFKQSFGSDYLLHIYDIYIYASYRLLNKQNIFRYKKITLSCINAAFKVISNIK